MLRKLVLILILLQLLVSPGIAIALEKEESKAENKENYILPFPGILPDHPLYPLKAIRDKVYGFLVADPTKKTAFTLLMADKRMGMSITLKDRGKLSLAEITVSKGSKYFEEAAKAYYRALQEGRDVAALRHKLLLASEKYEQIIADFQRFSSPDIKIGLQDSLDRIIKLRGEILAKEGKL